MTPREAHEYLEDFQRIMTQHREAYSKKLIEANGQAILALEKQIPKKRADGWYGKNTECPICHIVASNKFCPNCGQALDWSDTE